MTIINMLGEKEAADEVAKKDEVAKNSPSEMEDEEDADEAIRYREEDPSDAELEGNVNSLQSLSFTVRLIA